jgi:hypothetical protein
MWDALRVADMGARAHGRARPGSPAANYRIGDDHGKRVSRDSRRVRLVAMRTSMSTVIPGNDLSLPAASQSEGLDNPCDLQVWSRTCYTHVQ